MESNMTNSQEASPLLHPEIPFHFYDQGLFNILVDPNYETITERFVESLNKQFKCNFFSEKEGFYIADHPFSFLEAIGLTKKIKIDHTISHEDVLKLNPYKIENQTLNLLNQKVQESLDNAKSSIKIKNSWLLFYPEIIKNRALTYLLSSSEFTRAGLIEHAQNQLKAFNRDKQTGVARSTRVSKDLIEGVIGDCLNELINDDTEKFRTLICEELATEYAQTCDYYELLAPHFQDNPLRKNMHTLIAHTLLSQAEECISATGNGNYARLIDKTLKTFYEFHKEDFAHRLENQKDYGDSALINLAIRGYYHANKFHPVHIFTLDGFNAVSARLIRTLEVINWVRKSDNKQKKPLMIGYIYFYKKVELNGELVALELIEDQTIDVSKLLNKDQHDLTNS
jgi:hypothetical protein